MIGVRMRIECPFRFADFPPDVDRKTISRNRANRCRSLVEIERRIDERAFSDFRVGNNVLSRSGPLLRKIR